jgi:hypothetical protein
MAASARRLSSVLLGASLVAAGCELDTVAPVPTEPMTLVGGSRLGQVYVVDEADGATTFVGTVLVEHPHPFIEGAVPIGPITSMEWVPTADMWWVASSRRAPCQNCIYRFVPQDDSARVVRRLIEETDTITDFAVDPKNGRVYTFKAGDSGYLFRVNVVGGWFDEVSRSLEEGVSGKGTTFWSDDKLYVSGGLYEQRLTRIDLSRAASEDVGPLTYVGFPPFASYSVTVPSMVTRPSDGVVFALVQDGGGWAGAVHTTYLATVDPTNGVVQHVGTADLNALAYVPTRLIP